MTANKRLRILVVEDHHDTRNMLVFFLASLGHWVESCPDTGTALARLDYDGIDVLLTDVWFTNADGWSYLAELSKRGLLPPRVISMSAWDEWVERPRSKAAGCHAHLVKPFKASELEAMLQ